MEVAKTVRSWMDPATLQAGGRLLAGGYGAGFLLFFLTASGATLDRAVVQNALTDVEQRRVVLFLLFGIGAATLLGIRAAMRSREALAVISHEVFLAAPFIFLPLYEGVPLEHVHLLSAAIIAALAGFALHGFAKRSPRGAVLDRFDAPSGARIGMAVVVVLGLAHGAAMAWIAARIGGHASSLVQNIGLGIAAVPLYAIAMRLTKQVGVSLLVSVCFLLHPFIPGMGDDARVVPFALVIFGVAWAIFAFDTKVTPRMRMGLAAVLAWVIVPLLIWQTVPSRVANALSGFGDVVQDPDKWRFAALLLLPVALLPLLDLRAALLVVPAVVACLLGASRDDLSIEHAHAAPALPMVFLGMVLSLSRLKEPRMRTIFAIVALILTLLVTSKFAREPVLNGPYVNRSLEAVR